MQVSLVNSIYLGLKLLVDTNQECMVNQRILTDKTHKTLQGLLLPDLDNQILSVHLLISLEISLEVWPSKTSLVHMALVRLHLMQLLTTLTPLVKDLSLT